MFTLVTGLPGSGKSLHTIKLVEQERVRPDGSKRAVYYWGIPELKLDWIPLHAPDSTPEAARERYDRGVSHSRPEDAARWFEVPPESIVVIDEAQYVWPKLTQKQASAPPEHYGQLAIHRHSGTDLYAMTQHPSLIAVEARRQVQRHWHLERPFGLGYATRLAWERCMSPDDRSARAQAAVERLPLDSSIYGLYRSAEVHNVKARLPWKRVALLVGAVAGAAGLIWWGISAVGPDQVKPGPTVATSAAALSPIPPALASYDDAQFVVERDGWLWSAPFYRDHFEIKSVPRITGCMTMIVGTQYTCRCHNGQGLADVPEKVCRAFMAGHWFDPTREVTDAKAENVRRLEARENRSAGDRGDASAQSGAHMEPREP